MSKEVTKEQIHAAAVVMGRKGGETTKKRYGKGYYEAIGRKGGQKVKKLIAAGKAAKGE
jgi:general stress protein YciG